MRLFTAIDLSPEVLGNTEAILKALRPTAPIKWSPPSNLHITTKFIGEWPESRLDELIAAVGPVATRAAFDVSVGGLGWFPNPRNPRVLWAGVEAGDSLAALVRDTDAALAKIGITPESKPFSPHLTLARIRETQPIEGLRAAVSKLESPSLGQFTADRFWLYRSELHSSGSVYTKLSGFVFHT